MRRPAPAALLIVAVEAGGARTPRDALVIFGSRDSFREVWLIPKAHLIPVATGKHWLRRSFGQSGSPQSFFVSRETFMPIRAQHVFEIGNT